MINLLKSIMGKNLAYESWRLAKGLNPRQAPWALSFRQFCFILSYRPRKKNTDALSWINETKSHPEPGFILSCTTCLNITNIKDLV